MREIPLFVIAGLLSTLALFVYRAYPQRTINRLFAFQILLFSGWTLGVAGLYTTYLADLSGRLAFACASLIPAALLVFTAHYPERRNWPPRLVLQVVLSLGSGLAILSLTTPLIVSENEITQVALYRKAGPLYPLFATYFLVTWTFALLLLIYKWRGERGLARAHLQFVVAAIALSGAGGISVNLLLPLLTGNSSYSYFGPYFGLVFVALVAHAIIRHRLMDLRLVVHRGLTLGLAMLLSLLPVGALIAVFWPRLAGHLETEELLVLLAAVVIVTLLVPPARDVARRLLDRYVYRTYANYQRTVREASQMLTRVLDLKRLLRFISDTVGTSTGAEGVAIYLRDEDGVRRALPERRVDNAAFTAPEVAPDDVVAALEQMKEPIVAEELARDPVPAELRLAVERLLALDWALVLPVVSEDTVIAFITLGPKLSGDPYYPQDLDLLMTLANQAGIAVKNARLYAEVVLAREYIESIVATIESGVVAITASGRITMFNPAAERLTGLAAANLTGRSVSALPVCLGAQLTAAVGDGHAHTQPEIDLPDASLPPDRPATRPVICTTSPLRDPEGAILGAVAVFSDLTPFKELEIERQRAERIAYFEMLGSTIAHEIKNPLVAIKTFAQLVPRRRGDDRFVEDFSRITTREILRMEELLDRLRALSRPSERPLHALDLRVPIGEALEFLAPAYAEKRVTLAAALGETACGVLGDHAELEQLCLNLLMNALEATGPDGIVRIDLLRSDSHVRVSVSDTGPGIPTDLIARIFDPFFTTKHRGTGLGLAVSAQIAQTHGARLRAANRPSGGAVFTIEFPLTVITTAVVSA